MTNLTGKGKIPKGQEISEDFSCPQILPKNQRIFLQLSALAIKSGRIKQMNALYYAK